MKPPDVRRAEILAVAARLFAETGYAATTVDMVVRTAGVAKGTFYHYFKTKDDVLEALVRQTAARMAERSLSIACMPDLDPIEKLRQIFQVQRRVLAEDQPVVAHMHLPQNRQLHDRSNAETVLLLGPVLAGVVEEGQRSNIFNVGDALPTVQFILAGTLFLFDACAFDWTPAERFARLASMVTLSERALGASPGALRGLLDDALNEG